MSAIPVPCCGPNASSLRSREPAEVFQTNTTASYLRSAVDHRPVFNFAELKSDSRNLPHQNGRSSLHPVANCEINRSQCSTGGSTEHGQYWPPFDPSAVSAGSGYFKSFPLEFGGIRSESLRSVWPLSPVDVSASFPSTPSQRTPHSTSLQPVKCDPEGTTAFPGFASQPQLQLRECSMVPAPPSMQVLKVSPGVHVQRPSLCAEHLWDWGSSDSAATTLDAVTLNDDVFIPAIEPSALLALSQPALCSHAPKPPTSTRIPTGSNWSPNPNRASASGVALRSSTAIHSGDQTLAVFASPLPFDLIPPDSLERFRPPLNASEERSSTSVSASTQEYSTKHYGHVDLRSQQSSSKCLSEVQQQLNVGYTRKWSGIRVLEDTELMRLSIKELNRFLQRLGVPRDAAQAFKHRRRTLKNRVRLHLQNCLNTQSPQYDMNVSYSYMCGKTRLNFQVVNKKHSQLLNLRKA